MIWLVLAVWLGLLAHGAVHAAPVSLAAPAATEALGQNASYLVESDRRLDLAEAQAALTDGKFRPAPAPIVSFGIGAPPVWLHLAVANPGSAADLRRLLIENSWLDTVELHFVHGGRETGRALLGDSQPHAARPHGGRFFSVDHAFAPGVTDVFLRVATPDPVVLPIYLLTREQAADREHVQDYSYGFVYGYLIALLGYNAVLFLAIRDRRYLLYAIFLGAFVAMNLAYTGHGFAWFWPEQVTVQRWIIPLLMVAFGTVGLGFARCFLETRTRLPTADRVLRGLTGGFVLALGGAVLLGETQRHALLVAFVFAVYFSGAMLAVGLLAFRAKIPASPYFLLASIASMLGTAVTALSVWGWIDFADWRFRAVELGMLVDATLLAVALGSQFRGIQLEKALAELSRSELSDSNARLNASLREVERLASTDRLTGLWNRRHLEQVAAAEMARASRYQHAISLLLFDIDHFKRINDSYGHKVGDRVLEELARVVRERLRDSDVATRWGGEEFLVLMPNTALEDAVSVADKLRLAVEAHDFPGVPVMSISIGVAEWQAGDENLDAWIVRADQALYRAKREGRNRVVAAPRPGEAGAASEPPLLQLAWSPRYACGMAEIDRQHRALFQGANAILAMLSGLVERPAEPAVLGQALDAIDGLLQEVRKHFLAEEAILASHGWEQLDAHRIEHGRLLERAESLRRELRFDAPSLVASKLIDFLVREVIAGHILAADRDYFPLGQQGEPATAPVAGSSLSP